MSKAKIVRDSKGLFYGIRFDCPACRWPDGRPQLKVLPVNWLPPGETEESPHVAGKPHWSFNGDFENPVFGPSVLQWHGDEGTARYRRCHSFVGCNGAQPGQITFLGDCTHALAGQTVELPDID
ncbi:hypothetical protein ACI2VH_03025 [Ralstonia nicotianae]